MSNSESLCNCTGPHEIQPDCQPFVFYSLGVLHQCYEAYAISIVIVQDFLDILKDDWNRTAPNTVLYFCFILLFKKYISMQKWFGNIRL